MTGTAVLAFVWLAASAVWGSTRRRPGTSDEARTLAGTIAAILIAACLLVILAANPAAAHNADDIDTWVDQWTTDVLEAGGLTMTALDDLRDFQARHAWYFNPAPATATKQTPTPSSNTPKGAVLVPAGADGWRPLVETYFAAGDVDRALCLIHYESRGDPDATSSAGARGLLQVMPFWADHFGIAVDDLYDPAINLESAAKIRTIQGWSAWVPYNKGLCR